VNSKSLVLWFVILAPFAWAQDPPVKGPEEKPVSAAVEEILTRLERRSDGLKDIRCKIEFIEEDKMNLTKQTKSGRILLLMAEPNPKFLIHFEKSKRDGIMGKQEWYLFDGRWLLEAIERIQQVTKKEIARPGEKQDFFDIEKSPFPLPFGQKKDKILKNFHVELVKPVSTDPSNTDHLLCKPKPDSPMAKKYAQLDFFVERKVHLPLRVVITGFGGEETKRADFPDLSMKSINTGLKEQDFKPLKEWKDYDELVEPLPSEEPKQ
jgi:hypothetical protein